MRPDDDVAPRARIPADIDRPDKIVYGLTARQLAIVAVAAAIAYAVVKGIGSRVPLPILVAVLIPIVSTALVLALGRRDGLGLDVWLLAAISHSGSPKQYASAGAQPVPSWAPGPANAIAGLRLPADAITDAGVIDTGSHAVALVAASTINIGLRSGDEQAAVIAAYGRWLNGLTGPVQLVLSAQRVDLSSHAQRIADAAAALGNPALAEVACDYADFLDTLAEQRDPLWRTATIAVAAPNGIGADTEVLRRADQTASALAALGAQTAVLDGATVTAVLTCAVDPYSPADLSWRRTHPGAAVTASTKGLT